MNIKINPSITQSAHLCFSAFYRCSSLEHLTALFTPSSFEATLSFSLRRSLAPLATCQILGLTVSHSGGLLTPYQACLCSVGPFVLVSFCTLLEQIPEILVLVFFRAFVANDQTWNIVVTLSLLRTMKTGGRERFLDQFSAVLLTWQHVE